MPTRVHLEILLPICVLALTPVLGHSHGGGLDAYGCHNDREQHGAYHCHQGQFAEKAFASKLQMLEALERPPSPKSKPHATTIPAPLRSTLGPGQACIRENKNKQIICGELMR